MTIVRSEILSQFPELICGMSTADGGVSSGQFKLNLSYNVNDDPAHVKVNRRRFFESLRIKEETVAFTTQKHTDLITVVRTAGVHDQCDALITNADNIFLAISIADCTPVLVYDPVTSSVAGIHAGWRGTAGKIVEKALNKMQHEYHALPRNMFAFIGPSAGKCCYEVGKEVADQFPAECSVKRQNGKYLLDVKQANVIQLLDNGVSIGNIEMNQECTIHNTSFHSHRRDGIRSGRMFAVIGKKL